MIWSMSLFQLRSGKGHGQGSEANRAGIDKHGALLATSKGEARC
jgi:hypothetical protein